MHSLTVVTDSSGVSNTGGLQLQTILNAEDSPSRNSMPETPHSARGALHVRNFLSFRLLQSPGR
jgi:hypothetical protein